MYVYVCVYVCVCMCVYMCVLVILKIIQFILNYSLVFPLYKIRKIFISIKMYNIYNIQVLQSRQYTVNDFITLYNKHILYKLRNLKYYFW